MPTLGIIEKVVCYEKSQFKTSLAHLSPNKQKELAAIQEIILKHVPVEMIILFGSYARGDWVEDSYREGGTTYEYISDFESWLVSKQEIDPMARRWRALEAIIERRPLLTKAAIINHALSFLNEKIRHNYYFCVDLVKEGVMLYDSGTYELAAPQKLSPEKRLEKQRIILRIGLIKQMSFSKCSASVSRNRTTIQQPSNYTKPQRTIMHPFRWSSPTTSLRPMTSRTCAAERTRFIKH